MADNEPLASPLVRVLFTNGIIAADFLGDPTGTGLDMPFQTDRASAGLPAPPERGTPMDDALRPVDLDHRPVGVHGDDPAAGEAPQQTGAVQVVQRAR